MDGSEDPQLENDTEGDANLLGESMFGKEFIDQFTQLVTNVSPEDVVNFELEAGDKKAFYLTVTTAPATIQGAYSIAGGEKNKVHFNIYGPGGDIVFTLSRKKESIVAFETEAPGEYKLEFANKNVSPVLLSPYSIFPLKQSTSGCRWQRTRLCSQHPPRHSQGRPCRCHT